MRRYIKPTATVINMRYIDDMMEQQFTVSNYADGGGRAKSYGQTFDEDTENDNESESHKSQSLWDD